MKTGGGAPAPMVKIKDFTIASKNLGKHVSLLPCHIVIPPMTISFISSTRMQSAILRLYEYCPDTVSSTSMYRFFILIDRLLLEVGPNFLLVGRRGPSIGARGGTCPPPQSTRWGAQGGGTAVGVPANTYLFFV